MKVGVVVLIDVDLGKGAKIHGVRTSTECTVVLIRVEDLHRQRLPAAGRPAIQKPRPALTDATVLFFDVRDQLIGDGVAPGSHAGGIDCIRIIVVRRRVLDLDDQHAWLIWLDPALVVTPGFLLLDTVVAVDVEAFAELPASDPGSGGVSRKLLTSAGKCP